MTSKFKLEASFSVFNDEDGSCVEVKSHPDNDEWACITIRDDKGILEREMSMPIEQLAVFSQAIGKFLDFNK